MHQVHLHYSAMHRVSVSIQCKGGTSDRLDVWHAACNCQLIHFAFCLHDDNDDDDDEVC